MKGKQSFFGREDVAAFVGALLEANEASTLTMTIRPGPYGEHCVTFVTEDSPISETTPST